MKLIAENLGRLILSYSKCRLGCILFFEQPQIGRIFYQNTLYSSNYYLKH
jgi:hypothetical protein